VSWFRAEDVWLDDGEEERDVERERERADRARSRVLGDLVIFVGGGEVDVLGEEERALLGGGELETGDSDCDALSLVDAESEVVEVDNLVVIGGLAFLELFLLSPIGGVARPLSLLGGNHIGVRVELIGMLIREWMT
jgi:hypothetical protein